MEENETATDDSPQQAGERHWQEGMDDRPVDLDRIFELLSNRRRRAVLRYLDTEAREVEIGELVGLLAAREYDEDRPEITAQERKRVYIGLYQNHLLKMADVDAIDHDERSGRVERGPKFYSFLEHLPAEESGTGSPEVGPDHP